VTSANWYQLDDLPHLPVNVDALPLSKTYCILDFSTKYLGQASRQRPWPAPIASLSTTSSSFDSLFRVLFIFPSRYLFAIGLPAAMCLALGGVYRPCPQYFRGPLLQAALSSNPTRWHLFAAHISRIPCRRFVTAFAAQSAQDYHLLCSAFPGDGSWALALRLGGCCLDTTIPPPFFNYGLGFQAWAFLFSLAVTLRITVVFFSSAY